MIEEVNTTQARLQVIAMHKVGNKAFEESDVVLSDAPIDIVEPEIRSKLQAYFFSHFELPEFFQFTFLNGDLQYHAVYNLIRDLFNDSDRFMNISQQLAQHLFECSSHPNIKPGDFYVTQFQDLVIEDELVDAIGLFKVENQKGIFQLIQKEGSPTLRYQEGIDPEKMDKGALIFNSESGDGYRLLIVDKSNRNFEAVYWREEFLKIKPISSEYYQTKNYLTATKSFVSQQMAAEFDTDPADKADLLNKSIQYFKENEVFTEEEFSEQIFADPNIINSFQRYKQAYEEAHDVDLIESFEISQPAVKKQSRVFKSVIKLDRNFHIYVHGDRSKIIRGRDEEGRKFYQLYYDEEK